MCRSRRPSAEDRSEVFRVDDAVAVDIAVTTTAPIREEDGEIFSGDESVAIKIRGVRRWSGWALRRDADRRWCSCRTWLKETDRRIHNLRWLICIKSEVVHRREAQRVGGRAL